MYFCASCRVQNCAKKFGQEGEYPKQCPTLSERMPETLEMYRDETDYLLAHESSLTAPDHTESRLEKTIRFARNCGFHTIGLAFCIQVTEEARLVERMLRKEGFAVESLMCKMGHVDREVIGISACSGPMCNPVAQAEFLNGAHTELNIIMGLCVGHDSLFIRHSQAPVTVLAVKDHVFNNNPLEQLRIMRRREENL